jgi:GGDEF domain-containing protein
MTPDEQDDRDRGDRPGGLEPGAVGLRIRPGRGDRASRSRGTRRGRLRPADPAETSAALLRVATAAAAGESASDVLALAASESQRLLGATAVLVVGDEEGAVVTAAGPGAPDRRLRASATVAAALMHDPSRSGVVAGRIPFEGGTWGSLLALEPQAASDVLVDMGRLVGLALTREAERTRLLRLAATDALTGLANRRTFEERLDAEVVRARRHGRRLALATLDLDRFKRLNDAFGHDAGDDALRAAGAALARCARRADLVARVGGARAAERARAALAALSLGAGRLTASFGVAELHPGEPARALVRRADAALYRAKALGRDRVETAGPGTSEDA